MRTTFMIGTISPTTFTVWTHENSVPVELDFYDPEDPQNERSAA